ncbi:MAG: hypothetical protein KC620_21295, partial [Myxococcales bacterium]|nr:hypothetical protein [Myxococcales bacterium]
RVINGTPEPLQFVWLDFGCNAVAGEPIPAGQTVTINTREGYQWRVVNPATEEIVWTDRLDATNPRVVELGICQNAEPVTVDVNQSGGRFDYSTVDRQNFYTASCAANATGGEVVYRIAVDEPSIITAEVITADYDTSLFLRSACDDQNSEIVCNDDFNGLLSRLSQSVPAGVYYLYVDGFGNSSGTGVLDIVVEPDNDTPRQIARVDVPFGQLQATNDHFLATFYAPIDIDTYDAGGGDLRAAAVYDRSVLDFFESVVGLDEASFVDWFDQSVQGGLGVVSIDSLFNGEGYSFTGVAIDGAVLDPQELSLGLDEAAQQDEIAARLADGWHPTRCSVLMEPAVRYDCLWAQSDVGPWVAQGGLTPLAYAAFYGQATAGGLGLRDLSVSFDPQNGVLLHAIFDAAAAGDVAAVNSLSAEDLLTEHATRHLVQERALRWIRGYFMGEGVSFDALWGEAPAPPAQ